MTDIDCPRARTFMTPCIARDGSLALSDAPELVCVGCGADPRNELLALSDRHQPARRYRQIKDPVAAAERLREQSAEYVAGKDG